MPIKQIIPGVSVIDTDTHWSEPPDLWTSLAPAKYKDLVPQIKEHKGRRRWVVNGDIPLAGDSAVSAIAPDGGKMLGLKFLKHNIDMVHPASYDCQARLDLMDDMGVSHNIVYPNVGGFGNQNFLRIEDRALRIACVEIYNDWMADLQQRSGGRILPMALVPWWDIEASVAEIDRMHKAGARGIVMCSNPHDSGMPDFAQPDWRPFWEVCEALEMPVNFHIGASEGDIDWSGKVPYKSWPGDVKISLGGAAIFLGQLRWMVNLLVSDVPERHPNLKFVSVESGVGWIPFLLDALDYQCGETAPEHLAHLSLKPSEYFQRQFFGCFWFEHRTLKSAVEILGADNIMFETDIPHPTSLYPHGVERVQAAIADLAPDVQRKILQGNAAKLYKIGV
ncbi:MAG: amidohydrolase [Acidimicrobiia bacterium]|nr:amidohydrolase [Acidimicrobiia bacterium]MDH5288460.1 amidohydrolase [Acidimicrobiia bacterium]